MRVIKTIAVVLFVLIGIALVDHHRETVLPTPSGPFAVGRSTYVWSDATQADSMAPKPGAKREILVWVWYPAAPQQSPQTADDYLPAPWRTAVKRQRNALINLFLTRDLSRVRAHSIRDAKLAPQQHSFPVVLIRGGLASLVTGYTCLAEDLASHGYVVVGFDVPYRSSVVVFPDGRVIPRARQNDVDLAGGSKQVVLATQLVEAWSSDIGFALDQLERLSVSDPSGKFLGRLDMRRVGIFGHSLGGATALEFCHADSRCKAGIDVDGIPLGSVIREGINKPFMLLLSDHRSESDVETHPVLETMQSIYDRQPIGNRVWIMIQGANHYMFSDDGAMFKSPLLIQALRTLGIVSIDGRRQLALTAHYIAAFFDVYLKGEPASNLHSRLGNPEVVYLQ
jgi:dienelactone hydrolase